MLAAPTRRTCALIPGVRMFPWPAWNPIQVPRQSNHCRGVKEAEIIAGWPSRFPSDDADSRPGMPDPRRLEIQTVTVIPEWRLEVHDQC